MSLGYVNRRLEVIADQLLTLICDIPEDFTGVQAPDMTTPMDNVGDFNSFNLHLGFFQGAFYICSNDQA